MAVVEAHSQIRVIVFHNSEHEVDLGRRREASFALVQQLHNLLFFAFKETDGVLSDNVVIVRCCLNEAHVLNKVVHEFFYLNINSGAENYDSPKKYILQTGMLTW